MLDKNTPDIEAFESMVTSIPKYQYVAAYFDALPK